MQIVAVKDSNWNVAISGIKGVKFKEINELLLKAKSVSGDTSFQLFNADFIAGWKHLYYSAVNAVNAFDSGAGISRSLPLETLIYASGQNQISSAFKILGLTPGDQNVALLVFGKNTEAITNASKAIAETLGLPDDKILELNEEKITWIKEAYGVSDSELASVVDNEALTWLIIERGALLRR